MKNSKVALTIDFGEESKRQLDVITALMDFDSIYHSLAWAISLGEGIAKENAKGRTEMYCLKPELSNLITHNPKFFEALCEEGVLEWVKPFVMRKTEEAIK